MQERICPACGHAWYSSAAEQVWDCEACGAEVGPEQATRGDGTEIGWGNHIYGQVATLFKLWLVRAYNNYLRTAIVAAPDKERAIQAGRRALRVDCSVTEIRVPGYRIRVEPEPEQMDLWGKGGEARCLSRTSKLL